ncbi:LysE/ArgO family amino acid transporter [Bacillus sp. DJP31]|uniref:LysE/ArgO family amino acid transporter n=1 Tax=Bacillus sp. DJP31 TaxID=3409789 RepID=UPI003BB5801F
MISFFHGTLLAVGLILPLGVQNIFVINQGASQPTFSRVLPVILTASLCDSFLILLAISGISLLIFQIAWVKGILLILGIVFLLYMGWSIWRTNDIARSQEYQALTTKKQITFALSVSLLNPHAIIDTIGVIGTSSLAYEGSAKYLFTLGCLLISWSWFFFLAFVGKLIGKVDSTRIWQKRINRISSVIIWGIAGLLLFQIMVGRI